MTDRGGLGVAGPVRRDMYGGLNRPWATAAAQHRLGRPGVVTKRVISSAAGVACPPPSVEMCQAPWALRCGPATCTSWPAARSWATAKDSVSETPRPRLVSSSAAAWLWKICWRSSGYAEPAQQGRGDAGLLGGGGAEQPGLLAEHRDARLGPRNGWSGAATATTW